MHAHTSLFGIYLNMPDARADTNAFACVKDLHDSTCRLARHTSQKTSVGLMRECKKTKVSTHLVWIQPPNNINAEHISSFFSKVN